MATQPDQLLPRRFSSPLFPSPHPWGSQAEAFFRSCRSPNPDTRTSSPPCLTPRTRLTLRVCACRWAWCTGERRRRGSSSRRFWSLKVWREGIVLAGIKTIVVLQERIGVDITRSPKGSGLGHLGPTKKQTPWLTLCFDLVCLSSRGVGGMLIFWLA